jgi:hypothetical protein
LCNDSSFSPLPASFYAINTKQKIILKKKFKNYIVKTQKIDSPISIQYGSYWTFYTSFFPIFRMGEKTNDEMKVK